MDARTQSSNRLLRAGLVALVLVGLLVVVAIGARASHPLGHTHVRQRYVPQRVGNDLFTLFIVALGVCGVLFLFGLWSIRDEWHARESNWLRRFLASLAVLAFAALYFVAVHAHFHRHHAHPPGGNPRGTATTRSHLPHIVNPKSGAHFDWEFAAALGGLAVLAAAYFALRRRAAPELDPEPADEAEEILSAVVREAIDDLRAEPDPRRAVIAAYARMEAVLARHGHPRHAAEAPYEYVQRVLTELHVPPDAIAELTYLFELAKFSPHRIGEEMRERAIAAFVAVRDDVKVAA